MVFLKISFVYIEKKKSLKVLYDLVISFCIKKTKMKLFKNLINSQKISNNFKNLFVFKPTLQNFKSYLKINFQNFRNFNRN